MKIKDHSDGKYQVHLYADGNLVVRRNSDETVVGSVGTTEARTTGPTAPQPKPEPGPTPNPLPYANWVYDGSVSDRENIRRAYVGYLGREPSVQEIDAYLGNSIDVASDILDIAGSGEAARHRSKPPPTTPPHVHPNPIRGLLRSVNVSSDGAHFADDRRECLPIGLTWFGALDQRRADPQGYRRQLAAIVDAGYQYARVLFAVAGGDGYWNGHEVTPHDCTTTDGVSVRGWDDYNAQVIGLGQDFAAAGLQLFVSSGGLQSVFAGDLQGTATWATKLGGLLDESGVQVAFVDVNEAWQNWVTGSEPSPDDVYRYMISPFLDGYWSKPTIALRSAPPEGETCEGFNKWAGDIIQKHGHRGHFPQDHTTAVRHARGIYYDERGGVEIPFKRLGIESEPVGPGASVNTLDGEEQLALLCAANFMGGFAYVYHSAWGVRWWDGPIDQQPGFVSSPHVASYLPTDLMSGYTTILHGGLSDSPLTDADGFPDENRVDSVVTSDGKRFVTLVYGPNGYTRLMARVAVRFSIITPDTGESHRFTLRPGETLDIDYRAGRVLVGELL